MTPQWQEIKEQLFGELDMTQDIPDEELWQRIENGVSRVARNTLLSLEQREAYGRQIFNSFRKLDILQELLDDPEITEIMVNGSRAIFYEKGGRIFLWEKGTLTPDKLELIIRRMAGGANRTVNELQPIVDTRLPDGSRVNVVLSPIALDGSCISIRKFSREPMTMERLIALHSVSREAADLLALLVAAGYNIFVSGGTGSGKTTFLNALSGCIPAEQRVVTIEDSAELQLAGIPNLIRLETRDSNANGAQAITIRDLIRTALRMRPDRIIVGEVRGAEALDMLQAMNTGHDGSLSTGHANSSMDMLNRLETMVLMGIDLPAEAIRRQIASGIDILVHLGRMRDRTRKVLQISEITGVREGEICLHTLYRFCENSGKGEVVCGEWIREGKLQNRQKLCAAGLEETYRQREDGADGLPQRGT